MEKREELIYEGGVEAFVKYLDRNKAPLLPAPIVVKAERDGITVECALRKRRCQGRPVRDGQQEADRWLAIMADALPRSTSCPDCPWPLGRAYRGYARQTSSALHRESDSERDVLATDAATGPGFASQTQKASLSTQPASAARCAHTAG